jgi:radical SAM superfamily enzyme YgiQ (UPF0313 family)
MKILFIYLNNDNSDPIQIGSLSAYLKKYGHEVKMLSFRVDLNENREQFFLIDKTIKDFLPDFIGFSCYETAFVRLKEVAKHIKKKWPKIKIIAGGYFPTLCPLETISDPNVDIVCRGEGEEALAELMKGKKNDFKIQNLWFKKNGKIIQNPIRSLIEDLDKLPFPVKEILN